MEEPGIDEARYKIFPLVIFSFWLRFFFTQRKMLLVFSPRILALLASEELRRRLVRGARLLHPPVRLIMLALGAFLVSQRQQRRVLFYDYHAFRAHLLLDYLEAFDLFSHLAPAAAALNIRGLPLLHRHHYRAAFVAKLYRSLAGHLLWCHLGRLMLFQGFLFCHICHIVFPKGPWELNG